MSKPSDPPDTDSSLQTDLREALSFLSHNAREGHSSTLALLELQRIKPDLLPVALAAVLDVAGRAAAGELPPTASTVVVQAGGDISQTNNLTG